MKQVIFKETGLPESVLLLEEAAIPEPRAHESLIRITARNINPSDIMFIQGRYGITPKLPSSAGFEAAGEVEKSEQYPKGTRVIFTAIGTWKEYVCVPTAQLIPTPEGMSDDVACQAFVNPITAYGMLETSGLQKGQWLLITAGASAWGKLVIQMAKMRGIQVICTVRNGAQKQALLDLGATIVVDVQTENLGKIVRAAVETGVDAVFDAVGGEQGAKALACLKIGGRMLVFGLLSLEPIPLNSGLLIFKNLKVEGWWLTSWWESLGQESIKNAIKEVFTYLITQEVQVDVQEKFALSEFKKAVIAYQKEGRTGKILIC
jgi:NADPH:quinone reductase-like Zn-dependent oxidoreductase